MHLPGIDRERRAGCGDVQRRGGIERHRQIAGQPVARSAGNDRQRNAGAGERRRGFVDRAVAAPRDDEIDAAAAASLRESTRVARARS